MMTCLKRAFTDSESISHEALGICYLLWAERDSGRKGMIRKWNSLREDRVRGEEKRRRSKNEHHMCRNREEERGEEERGEQDSGVQAGHERMRRGSVFEEARKTTGKTSKERKRKWHRKSVWNRPRSLSRQPGTPTRLSVEQWRNGGCVPSASSSCSSSHVPWSNPKQFSMFPKSSKCMLPFPLIV